MKSRWSYILLGLIVIVFGCTFVQPKTIDRESVNIVDNDSEKINKNNYTLSYWGQIIDVMTDEEWQDYLIYASQLRDIGVTHVGIKIWRINPTSRQKDITSSRINDLRKKGFYITLNHGSGHRILTDDDELDPNNHESNGQNLKYWDSIGFNPLECAPRWPCPDSPSRRALDPAYDGVVWQKELDFLDDVMKRTAIGGKPTITNTTAKKNDIMLFDVEVWGAKISYLHAIYPGVLMNSVERYCGTLEEREDQYFSYWSQRGKDLRDRVKQRNKRVRVYFYNENIPELERVRTSMPGGVGDVPSPSWYFMPNISRLQKEMDKGDFRGTLPWISFSITNYKWVDIAKNQPNSGWLSLRWDPKVTQKMGYLLKQEGAAGAFIYPGPGQHSVPVDYYMMHAQAFVDGFVNGVDPGELVEICGDEWDNDGDGMWNEGCDLIPESPNNFKINP